MEIVIKISKELYKQITVEKEYFLEDGENLCTAVANGTPLPKGHGRLIDADRLECDYFNRIYDDYAFDCIDNAPTIIKADISGMLKQS